jgi:hypothetical protein
MPYAISNDQIEHIQYIGGRINSGFGVIHKLS